MIQTAKYRQTRSFGSSADLFADARVNTATNFCSLFLCHNFIVAESRGWFSESFQKSLDFGNFFVTFRNSQLIFRFFRVSICNTYRRSERLCLYKRRVCADDLILPLPVRVFACRYRSALSSTDTG